MILHIVTIQLRRLWHSKSDLVLIFVVPILFFSIFAMIFGDTNRRKERAKISLAIWDRAQSIESKRILKSIEQSNAFRWMRLTGKPDVQDATQFAEGELEALVRRGRIDVGLIVHPSESPSMPARIGNIQILADSFDPIASQFTEAFLQNTLNALAVHTHPSAHDVVTASSAMPAPSWATNLANVETIDVLGQGKSNPTVAMYAAGIAVMFLLFSMSSSSASLLDEKENGTFERILTTQVTIDQLLLGKWLFMVIQGWLQVTLMFVWGYAVFGIALFQHLDGFMAMTVVTVGAAASFTLFLATLCKTRSQLNWVSVVIILTMSALGGSMVPRYLMSPSMQQAGLWTFNAWALEGYNKVFWRELSVAELSTELAVLTLTGFCFLLLARATLQRWAYRLA